MSGDPPHRIGNIDVDFVAQAIYDAMSRPKDPHFYPTDFEAAAVAAVGAVLAQQNEAGGEATEPWRVNAGWMNCWCADKTPCEYHSGWRDGYEHLQDGDIYTDASAEALRVRLRKEWLERSGDE